ncbi:MAG: hypothetical protein OEV78_05990 [Spirochaetia bacterium]|nr:hypothetical protein [Spirochaetia bacterium]
MKLNKIIKKELGFEYIYSINYREGYLRASITIFTDLLNNLKSIKYVSTIFGVAQVDKNNHIEYGYLWENENEVEKLSYLSKHYTALFDNKVEAINDNQVNDIINDCLKCADDLNLINFIRKRGTIDEKNIFPDFEFSIENSEPIISTKQADENGNQENVVILEKKHPLDKFSKVIKLYFNKFLNIILMVAIAFYFSVKYYQNNFNNKNPLVSIDDAHNLVKLGKIEDAIKVYWNLLYQNPDQCEIGVELANYLFFSDSSYGDTYQWINQNYYTFNPNMQLTLAYLDHRRGLDREAMLKLDQLKDIKKMEKCSLHIIGNINLKKNTQKAIEIYKNIIELEPKYVYPYINLGSIYLYSGKEELGKEYIEKAKKLDKDNYFSYYIYGRYLYENKKYLLAKKEYEIALRKNPKIIKAKYELNDIDFKIENESRAKSKTQ